MSSPILDPLEEAEARRQAQMEEFGTYAAAEQIYTPGGSLAYDVGHPVPVSNVTADGSVVTARHSCPPLVPGQPECPIEQNKIVATTGPGAAVRVDLHKKSTSTKSTTTAKSKDA